LLELTFLFIDWLMVWLRVLSGRTNVMTANEHSLQLWFIYIVKC